MSLKTALFEEEKKQIPTLSEKTADELASFIIFFTSLEKVERKLILLSLEDQDRALRHASDKAKQKSIYRTLLDILSKVSLLLFIICIILPLLGLIAVVAITVLAKVTKYLDAYLIVYLFDYLKYVIQLLKSLGEALAVESDFKVLSFSHFVSTAISVITVSYILSRIKSDKERTLLSNEGNEKD